jgi:hypothetical protein
VSTRPKAKFLTIRDVAEQLVKLKFPKQTWKGKRKEREEWVKEFCHRIRELDFRRQFPNLRFGVDEAVQRAKAGSRDDLYRLLTCFREDMLWEKWVGKIFRKAYMERDAEFMHCFFWAMDEPRKTREGRHVFEIWFLFNQEQIEGKTAGEILRAWNEKRGTLPVRQFGAVPTFSGDNAEHNFRRWLTMQGFKLGHEGKHSAPRPRK